MPGIYGHVERNCFAAYGVGGAIYQCIHVSSFLATCEFVHWARADRLVDTTPVRLDDTQ